MQALAGAIGSVLVLIALGVLLRRVGLLEQSDNESLNKLIVYLALPALVFSGVHGARMSPRLLVITLVAWATFLVCLGVAWAVGRGLKLPPATLGGFLLVTAIGNTGYLGFPLVIAFLGKQELVKAFFYDLFGTALMILTVGVAISKHYGSPGDEAGPATSPLREILTFPPIVALAVGFVLRPVAVPPFVMQGIEHLADLTVPLVMLTIGVSLEVKAFKDHPRPLVATTIIKLALAPAVAWGLWMALGAAGLLGSPAAAYTLADAASLAVVVLEASMPAAMLSYALGLKYRLDVRFIPSAIVLTTLASLATVPLWQVAARLAAGQ